MHKLGLFAFVLCLGLFHYDQAAPIMQQDDLVFAVEGLSDDELRVLFPPQPAAEGTLSLVRDDKNKTILWTKCGTWPILGYSCISIYDVVDNLTLGLELTAHNQTFDEPIIHGNQTCLDDTALLKLVELIPQLAPYKKIIDKIIAATGFIPGEVLSVCVDITKFNLDQKNHTVSGCADLDEHIMCWKKKCLYEGDKDLGCFKKHY